MADPQVGRWVDTKTNNVLGHRDLISPSFALADWPQSGGLFSNTNILDRATGGSRRNTPSEVVAACAVGQGLFDKAVAWMGSGLPALPNQHHARVTETLGIQC